MMGILKIYPQNSRMEMAMASIPCSAFFGTVFLCLRSFLRSYRAVFSLAMCIINYMKICFIVLSQIAWLSYLQAWNESNRSATDSIGSQIRHIDSASSVGGSGVGLKYPAGGNLDNRAGSVGNVVPPPVNLDRSNKLMDAELRGQDLERHSRGESGAERRMSDLVHWSTRFLCSSDANSLLR